MIRENIFPQMFSEQVVRENKFRENLIQQGSLRRLFREYRILLKHFTIRCHNGAPSLALNLKYLFRNLINIHFLIIVCNKLLLSESGHHIAMEGDHVVIANLKKFPCFFQSVLIHIYINQRLLQTLYLCK